jgi:NifU-like protein involved in Fe-S cluster formation
MKFPYNEKVLDHFRHPRNVGKIEDADGKAMEGSPACGDMVSVQIKVNEKTKRIQDIKFESYGCASNIATGSIITELAKGKTLEEAKKISWKQASDELGGLPAIKAHCSVLAVEGLRSAIRNYEEKHGLVTDKTPTTIETIEKRLRKVMNPLSGLDLVGTKLIKKIELKEGVAKIDVDLPENHQFANSIKEEIMEKIAPLHDIKKVSVTFNG